MDVRSRSTARTAHAGGRPPADQADAAHQLDHPQPARLEGILPTGGRERFAVIALAISGKAMPATAEERVATLRADGGYPRGWASRRPRLPRPAGHDHATNTECGVSPSTHPPHPIRVPGRAYHLRPQQRVVRPSRPRPHQRAFLSLADRRRARCRDRGPARSRAQGRASSRPSCCSAGTGTAFPTRGAFDRASSRSPNRSRRRSSRRRSALEEVPHGTGIGRSHRRDAGGRRTRARPDRARRGHPPLEVLEDCRTR